MIFGILIFILSSLIGGIPTGYTVVKIARKYDAYSLLFAVLLFIAIVIRHISSNQRLIHGQENRIGSGKGP
jgi:glycerol-3-phosphate acyltransferase PlsY